MHVDNNQNYDSWDYETDPASDADTSDEPIEPNGSSSEPRDEYISSGPSPDRPSRTTDSDLLENLDSALQNNHAPLAGRLAERGGMSIEEVESAAQKYRIDLNNPDSRSPDFLKFMSEVIPEIQEGIEEVRSLQEKKTTQDNEAIRKANERNSQATANRRDADSTDLSMYKTLQDGQTYQDAGSQDLIRAGNDLIESIKTAVEPLSMNLSAIDSSALESGSHPLFTALDIDPLSKPELIPMAWDGHGRRNNNFNKHEWPAWVEDYPKYEYNGRYDPQE